MPNVTLTLAVLPELFAVCRLDPHQPIPTWATQGRVFSLTRASDELSIVCPQQNVPAQGLGPGAKVERGWRAFQFEGPLDFSLSGVLSAVTVPLADAGISIFAISTYNTDYVLVREGQLEAAITALSAKGHSIHRAQAHR